MRVYLAPVMADTHGHEVSQHSVQDGHAVEEEVVRTPWWLPVVGVGLLVLGALVMYLQGRSEVATSQSGTDAGVEASTGAGGMAQPAEK